MIFDYMRTVQSLDIIDIADIGNTCINAFNDEGEEWFLTINTYQGWTETVEFGPLVTEQDKIRPYFSYNRYSYEYNEKKLERAIDKFINNPSRRITQVFEVEKDEAKSRLDAIKDCL